MWEVFWLALISAFLIDQITKLVVIKSKIHYLINKYGPLGLYKKRPYYRPAIWSLHIAIIIPLFFTTNIFLFLGAGLISAQISNLFDRFSHGGAVDFIPFPTPFPKLRIAYFNLADISILIGNILYLIGLFKISTIP